MCASSLSPRDQAHYSRLLHNQYMSGQAMYERFAGEYAEHAATGSYNALYDRPAVLELAGPVPGLRVLDAGCGPGLYTQELLARGARVTAFHQSPSLVHLARDRVGTAAVVRVHDLAHTALGSGRFVRPGRTGFGAELRRRPSRDVARVPAGACRRFVNTDPLSVPEN